MAANIQFDDDFIYQEIAKTPQARAIPMTQLLRDEAQQAFVDWQHNNKKIAYWRYFDDGLIQCERILNARASSWTFISNSHFEWVVMSQSISVCSVYAVFARHLSHVCPSRAWSIFIADACEIQLRCSCLQLQNTIAHANAETYRPVDVNLLCVARIKYIFRFIQATSPNSPP